MSALPLPHLTPEEYLQLERQSEHRHEYLRGVMYAMAGGRLRHSVLVRNLIVLLGTRFQTGPCEPFTSETKVRVNDEAYFYPDASLVCGKAPWADDPGNPDNPEAILLNPLVVCEVLSPSTRQYDEGRKFDLYRQVASLREYILIDSDRVRVERHVRAEDDHWVAQEYTGLESVLSIAAAPCEIPLRALYRTVEIPLELAPSTVSRQSIT